MVKFKRGTVLDGNKKIFIDPAIIEPDELAQLKNILDGYQRVETVLFLSPWQQNEMEKMGLAKPVVWGLDWDSGARYSSARQMITYWDFLEDLKESEVTLEYEKNQYTLNVPKIFRFHLGNLLKIFTICHILNINSNYWKSSPVIAIGKDMDFFLAVRTIAAHLDGHILEERTIKTENQYRKKCEKLNKLKKHKTKKMRTT